MNSRGRQSPRFKGILTLITRGTVVSLVMQYKTALFVSFHSLWKWSTKQSLWFLHQRFKMSDQTEEIWDTVFYLPSGSCGGAVLVCKPS